MERVPERPLEPPERRVVGLCDACGCEIYEGEAALHKCAGGVTLHRDCLIEYCAAKVADRVEELATEAMQDAGVFKIAALFGFSEMEA